MNFQSRIPANLFATRRHIVEALLVALFLIVIVFPDVIFLGASFRQTDQIVGSQHNISSKSIYPIPTTTGWWGGYNDSGGAVFQAEPMIEFMKYCIRNGESPYWNPYSAAGSLGPETLVDQKFSVFTLVNATLGGSSLTYNVITLLFFYIAVFFFYRIAREHLQLSALAGTGICLFYLLNGYSSANFASNVSQSYFYIPMCLFAVFAFLQNATIARFVAIVLSFTALLSCTFIPTTVTSLIGIYAIIIGYTLARIQQGEMKFRTGVTLILLQSFGILLSVLLLAFLYLPIFENIKSTGTLEAYAGRVFYSLNFPQAIASFFSPSHFFESYNAMEISALSWARGSQINGINGNTVFHMGTLAIVLACCSLPLRRHKYKQLLISCSLCMLLILLRLFQPELIGKIMSYIPVIGQIGAQYWWPPLMLPMTILLGVGIDNLQRNNARISAAFVLLAAGIYAAFVVYSLYGFHAPNINFKLAALLLLSTTATAVVAVLLTLRFNKNASITTLLVFSLVAALFVELMVDSKMTRLPMSDIFLKPDDAVSYVQKNIGMYRTLSFQQHGLYGEMGSALQIQESSSSNQGTLPGYQNYFSSAIQLEITQQFGTFPSLMLIQDKPLVNKFDWPDLDLLGIKYLLVPSYFTAYRTELIRQGIRLAYETPATAVFENPNVLPRAFMIAPPASKEDSLSLPMNFREHIQPVTITSYRNAEVEMKGVAAEEMLVVLSDNWHKNWHAMLNGTTVPILKVNGTFRGVIVPKGNYVIKMDYRPRTLSFALALSSTILLLLLIMLFTRRRLDMFIRRKIADSSNAE